jgi:hypothetical protein
MPGTVRGLAHENIQPRYGLVIASAAKQSHFQTEIASSPAAPRNDIAGLSVPFPEK